jgi:hypothetical protein
VLCVTIEEEFGARSLLKWQRDGDGWVLLYRRRQMGRLVPDPANPVSIGPRKSGDFSDISNRSWAKDVVLAQAIREVAYEFANDPSKCPVKRGGLKKQFRHPCVFLRRLSDGPNETPLKPQTQISVLDRDQQPRPDNCQLWSRPCQTRMDFASQNDGLLTNQRDRGDSKTAPHPHHVRPYARVS